MSDDIKPKLGMRAPLGLNKTVEIGKVKQSFSHGRSKSVVVEVKRARVLRRPGDPAPVEVEVEIAPAAAPVVAPIAAPIPEAVPARPVPPPVMFTPVERVVAKPAPQPVVTRIINNIQKGRRRHDQIHGIRRDLGGV